MRSPSQLSFQDSKFSHFTSPLVTYHPEISSLSFKSCLFSKFQTTSIIPSRNYSQLRVFLRFDGITIPKSIFNVSECIFRYCFSHNGPGCLSSKSCWGSIQHCEFTSNKGLFGGAFHVTSMKRMSFIENQFNRNTADHFGAAYVDLGLDHPLICYNNNFTQNRGNKWVGAFEIGKSFALTLSQFLIFNGNWADQCAAYFDFSILPQWHNLDMVLFLNNSARKRGGAITMFIYSSRANYSNCVFIGNKCKEGNCIYIETKSIEVYVSNCYFDCPKDKVSYEKYGDGDSVKYFDNVFFDGEKISEKKKEVEQKISPIRPLDWFIP